MTPAVSSWAIQKKVWLLMYRSPLRRTKPPPRPACLPGAASPSCCTLSGDCGACLHHFDRVCAVSAAAGIFPFRTSMSRRGGRTGYVEVEARQGCLFPAGCKLRGHICHSSEILQVGFRLLLGSTHLRGLGCFVGQTCRCRRSAPPPQAACCTATSCGNPQVAFLFLVGW